MAYRFRPSEPIPIGTRRIFREQINSAISSLADHEHMHQGVHQARKNIKCLRSLLRLIRPGFKSSDFKTKNQLLRDTARTLSGARDAQAMLEALAKLETRSRMQKKELLVGPFRSWLYDWHHEAENYLNQDTLSQAIHDLRQQKKNFSKSYLKTISFSTLAEGMERTYKSGRSTLVNAIKTQDGEQFHEWRKDAQRHWRQMQLLRPAWPQMLNMREKFAHELSRFLGDDHDLEVLGALARKHDTLFDRNDDLDLLLESLKNYQDDLRNRATHHGKLLYAEKPVHFRMRMTTYWKASTSSTT